MIDIEQRVYTTVTTPLRSSFDPIYIYGEEVRTPSLFPAVTIVEIDNYVYKRTMDSGSNERHSVITYEVTVYSNKTTGKKAECKEILAVVDEKFMGIGFTRSMTKPVPMDDATAFKLVARYSAVVSDSGKIYNRR
jgi:hypothetical protein